MPRPESTAKGGFYAFPEAHIADLAALFRRAKGSILDPCAGEGVALQHLSERLGLTPYAIELEPGRAEQCQALFGAEQVLNEDIFQVSLTPQSMQMCWVNPPFTEDLATGKRLEFQMLEHSWQWLQQGGWMVFISYSHHISRDLAAFVAERSRSVELYRLPGKHFGTYTYTVLIAQAGRPLQSTIAVADRLYTLAHDPDTIPLLADAAPGRILPTPTKPKEFYFHRRVIRPEDVLHTLAMNGADLSTAFRLKVQPAKDVSERVIRPVVRPKLGHLLTLIASGLFNYVDIHTERGRAILRSTIKKVEVLTDTEDTGKGKKEVYQIKPITTITLLHENGEIEDVSEDWKMADFIQTYKDQLFAHAERQFKPLYDITGDSPEKRRWLPHLARQRVKGRFRLFPAQQHVAAAVLTTLEHKKKALFVGQMSVGKTAMSIAMMDAWYSEGRVKPGQVFWVNCPGHLVKKWKREINQQLPKARVTMLVLESKGKRQDILAQLSASMRQAEQQPDRLHILIGSQDVIKLGEGWEAAINYKFARGRNIPICPTTGVEIRDPEGDSYSPYLPIDALEKKQWFAEGEEYIGKENHRPAYRQLPDRGYPLWQDIRKYGLPKGNNGRAVKQRGQVATLIKDEPIADEWIALKGIRAPRNPRGPIWRLMQSQYKGRIAIAFFDEAHESKSIDSDRYRSMAAIARCADACVGLTGTVFNGYASSLLGLETIFNPDLFRDYEWGNAGVNQWIRDMGVLEKVIEYKEEYSDSGRHSGTKRINHGAKEIPGASPLLIRTIIDHTIFMSLSDLGKALPSLEETPVAVEMLGQQLSEYQKAESILGSYLKACKQDGDVSFLAAYFRTLLSWPDTAFLALEVLHMMRLRTKWGTITEVKERHVHTFPALDDPILPKEQELIDLVRDELKQGRGVGVFVQQTGKRDYQQRLARLLEVHAGATPAILQAKVKPIDREEWVDKQFESGANVLICNPMLVQTGLDLIATPTLIFYEPEYKLSVLKQASHRHWRIPQTKACRTLYLYYLETFQEKAMALIAKKLAALAVVNGESANLSALGAGGGDILKELMKGDVDYVDLQAEFAKINARSWDESEWDVDDSFYEPDPDEADNPRPTPNIEGVSTNLVQLSLF